MNKNGIWLVLFICFLWFLSRGRDGQGVIAAAHNIPANTVIQADDLEYGRNPNNLLQDLILANRRIHRRGDIIGHKALHAIPEDKPIEHGDID